MMVTRAYLMPYVDGMVKTAAYDINGGLSGVRRGMGDVNSQAAGMLTAAGYTNVVCKPTQVSYGPFAAMGIQTAPTTQNICTATQNTNGMSAEGVASMTQAQVNAEFASIAPYSSDAAIQQQLAALTGNAQAEQQAQTGVNDTLTGAAYNAQVLAQEAKGGDTYIATGPLQQQAAQVPAGIANTTSTNGTPIFNITLPSGASAIGGLSLGGSTLISGVPDLVVYAGGALAAFLLIGMMGGRH